MKAAKRPSGDGKKGLEQSGGLSPAQVQALARRHAVEALRVLAEVMRDPGADLEARAAAAEELRLRLRQLGSRYSGREAQGEGR